MTNDLVSCPCSAPYDPLVVVDDYAILEWTIYSF